MFTVEIVPKIVASPPTGATRARSAIPAMRAVQKAAAAETMLAAAAAAAAA